MQKRQVRDATKNINCGLPTAGKSLPATANDNAVAFAHHDVLILARPLVKLCHWMDLRKEGKVCSLVNADS